MSEPRKDFAECVRGEQAVQVGADDAAIRRHGAFHRAVAPKRCLFRVDARGDAEMDFISLEFEVACRVSRHNRSYGLVVGEDGVDGEEPKPSHAAARTFDPVGVGESVRPSI